MNGYKTGGDWTDVTSVGRNEIVFEGRHKDYGAYYIRQRYPNVLLLSLMSAIGIMVACALIPYVFKVHIPVVPKLISDYVVKPTDVLIHRTITALPPSPHQPIHSSKNMTTRLAPPVITNTVSIDSTIVEKPNKPVTTTGAGNPEGTMGTPDSGSSGIVITPPPAPDYNKPVIFASTMPKFPGGKIDDYLARQLQYPADEAKSGIQGTVYASFIIERDGSVSSITLLRGINNGDELNQEALRVLSEMPRWVPGNQNGHAVRVQYVVPIHFKLQ